MKYIVQEMKNHSILEQARKGVGRLQPWFDEWAVSLLTVISFFFLHFLPSEFKLYFLGCAIVLVALALKTRNILLVVFILLFVTSPFLSPGKYYSFALIQPNEVRWEAVRETGVIEAYGLVMSDLFALFAVYLSVRGYILQRRKKSLPYFSPGITLPKVVLGVWILYAAILLMSSAMISGYPIFAVVSSLQFCKFIIVCLAILCWFKQDVLSKKYLCQIILGLLFCINILAISEFLNTAASLGLNQVNREEIVEENHLLPRPTSVFLHANQLAFVDFALILTVLLLNSVHKKYSPVIIAILSLSGVVVLFTQSRAIWIIASATFLVMLWKWRATLLKKYGHTLLRYRHLILVLVSLALIFFVLPRIYYTQYSDDGGSLSIRSRMIKEGTSALLNSPLFGFGANTNVEVMLRYSPKGYIQDFPFAVHLGYLQIALEAGILGVICFFFPWLELYRRSVRMHQITKELEIIKFRKFLITSSICFVFVYYVFQPHTGRIDFFYLGVLMAVCMWALQNKESSKV